MKNKFIVFLLISSFIIELFICFIIFLNVDLERQDTIVINECIKKIEENYDDTTKYCTNLEYTIIDNDKIIYKTPNSNINSINDGVLRNSINLDLIVDGDNVGKILINSNVNLKISKFKKDIGSVFVIFSIVQVIFLILYFVYINRSIVRPFKKLNMFAVRIANGNLDIPLYMDRGNLFGSFTEAFDLMRSELKRARISEKRANDAKKEMVAKLSHDIKTPVASIKATSEIGYEKSDGVIKNYFNQINVKTDQIKVLVDNLFNSSVNEVTEIDVNASKFNSSILEELIVNSDYMNKSGEYIIPNCNVYIDKVRLQQVFDNVINNSYKYANTNIDVSAVLEDEYLKISFRDYGSGVDEMDLPLLKDKFKRGSNVKDEDGAGLGLYLANYFMEKMNGKLELKNSNPGLVVILFIRVI